MSEENGNEKRQEQIIGGSEKPPETLWEHQRQALKALNEIAGSNKAKFSTIINLPTGSGKTEVIRRFCMERLEEGDKILFIADRIALLEQSINKFCEYKNDKSDKGYSYQLICGDHGKAKKDNNNEDDGSSVSFKKEKIEKIEIGTNIIFASTGTIRRVAEKRVPEFDSWIRESQEDNKSQEAGKHRRNIKRLYIVYDEAHHIGAEGAGAFMSAIFNCKDTYVKGVKEHYRELERVGLVGLTATVFRGDNFIESFNAWFKDGYDFANNKILHINSKYGDYLLEDIGEIRNNRIAPADVKQLLGKKENGKIILSDPDFIKVSEFKDGKPDTVEKEMEYLADRIDKNFSELGKTAVIVKNHDMVVALCKQLKTKGIDGIDFSSEGLKGKNRYDILNKFKGSNNKDSNNNLVLVAISIFDEGIDIVDLNTLYLYDSTNSQLVLRQRVGRVLRTAKGDNPDKRVIWQYYPQDCELLTEEKYKELLESDFAFVKESEEDFKRDIAEWEGAKGKIGIPPIMYKEPLPKEELFYTVSPTDKIAFEKIYGKDAIAEGESVGCFYDASKLEDEDKIYVRKIERDGYMQYHRVLQNDWLSIHGIRHGTCTFKQYARLLRTSEPDLIADIKKICFSLSVKDAFRKNGTVKNTVVVIEDDIKKFYGWFISGEIRYKEVQISGDGTGGSSYAGKIEELLTDSYKEGAKCEEFPKLQGEPNAANVRHLKNIYQQIKAKGKAKKAETGKKVANGKFCNRAKEYTDVLSYGSDGKYVYQDVQRMRVLLKAGIIDKPREYLTEENENKKIYKEKAFLGISEDGEEIEVEHIERRTLSAIKKEDWLLIASALVEVPNHLYVEQKDVNKYEQCVKAFLGKDDEKLVKEYLMALGYAKNESILRYQCKHFKPTPKLLKYMVYEKIYKELSKIVCFYDDKGNLYAECQNKSMLECEYDKFIGSYGIDLSDDLDPVKDAIYDYRPYMKAVPYYQGIKPEFLCRMLNDGIQLLNIEPPEYIVDGFGGSGAVSMNSFYKKNFKATHIYNDLGMMNTSFYRMLKSDRSSLERRVDEIIEEAFSLGSKKYVNALFAKYKALIEDQVPLRKAELKELKKTLKKSEKNRDAINAKIAGLGETKELLEELKEIEAQIKGSKEKLEKKQSTIKRLKKCKKLLSLNYDVEGEYVKRFNERVNGYRNPLPSKKSLRAVWIQNRLMHFYKDYAEDLEMTDDNEFQALIREVEKNFHVFMLRCFCVYQILTSEADENAIQKFQISDEDLAIVFFFYNSLSHRHFYNDCTFERIMRFVQEYKDWLAYGEQVFQNVDMEKENALKLLTNEKYNIQNALWYLDIPYIETDSSDYVQDSFKVEEFINSLRDNKGTYIVSSRCNICLPDEDESEKSKKKESHSNSSEDKGGGQGKEAKDTADSEGEEDTVIFYEMIFNPNAIYDKENDAAKNGIKGTMERYKKEFHVFDFFNSFVDSKYAEGYESCIKEIDAKEAKKIGKIHLEGEREAKYILISFTKCQEEFMEKTITYEKQEEKQEKKQLVSSIVKNNVRIDENYIRRMIASTHYSKIPVEVMITNADIDMDEKQLPPMPIQKVTSKIGVLPTFKTGIDVTQYMAEPLVVYMKYEKFMDIMLQLLCKDAWEKYSKKKSNSAWTKYFRSKLK